MDLIDYLILNTKALFQLLVGIIVDYHGFALSYYIIGSGVILSGFILTTINCYSFIEKVEKQKNLDSSKEPISLSV